MSRFSATWICVSIPPVHMWVTHACLCATCIYHVYHVCVMYVTYVCLCATYVCHVCMPCVCVCEVCVMCVTRVFHVCLCMCYVRHACVSCVSVCVLCASRVYVMCVCVHHPLSHCRVFVVRYFWIVCQSCACVRFLMLINTSVDDAPDGGKQMALCDRWWQTDGTVHQMVTNRWHCAPDDDKQMALCARWR